MHSLIRNTHLMLGLFSVLFLMMYGLSAFQMAHGFLFDLRPAVTTSTIGISPGRQPREAAQELMNGHQLRGELRDIRTHPDGWNFRVVRPGTVYEVTYHAATGATDVKTSTAGFWGMLNRIHHVGGLWHGYSLINIWGAFTGIISLCLLLIGATGVYLWFKMYNERRIGAILLGGAVAFGLVMVTLIRTA